MRSLKTYLTLRIRAVWLQSSQSTCCLLRIQNDIRREWRLWSNCADAHVAWYTCDLKCCSLDHYIYNFLLAKDCVTKFSMFLTKCVEYNSKMVKREWIFLWSKNASYILVWYKDAQWSHSQLQRNLSTTIAHKKASRKHAYIMLTPLNPAFI